MVIAVALLLIIWSIEKGEGRYFMYRIHSSSPLQHVDIYCSIRPFTRQKCEIRESNQSTHFTSQASPCLLVLSLFPSRELVVRNSHWIHCLIYIV